MDQGTVKFFNATKGFGFVTTKEGEDIFFHKSNVKNTGFREVLLQGDAVQFEIKVEQKGKKNFLVQQQNLQEALCLQRVLRPLILLLVNGM